MAVATQLNPAQPRETKGLWVDPSHKTTTPEKLLTLGIRDRGVVRKL